MALSGVSLQRHPTTRDTPCTTQIYDGAANLWRTVVVASVAVRWIDLGTKLVLRHVVRVLGAEQEGHSSHNNNQNENDSENEGAGTTQEISHRGEGIEEGGNTGATSRTDDGAKARAATAEVDLDEVRWAECTGREKERRLSKSNAKKLAGKRHPLIRTPGGTNLYNCGIARQHATEAGDQGFQRRYLQGLRHVFGVHILIHALAIAI